MALTKYPSLTTVVMDINNPPAQIRKRSTERHDGWMARKLSILFHLCGCSTETLKSEVCICGAERFFIVFPSSSQLAFVDELSVYVFFVNVYHAPIVRLLWFFGRCEVMHLV